MTAPRTALEKAMVQYVLQMALLLEDVALEDPPEGLGSDLANKWLEQLVAVVDELDPDSRRRLREIGRELAAEADAGSGSGNRYRHALHGLYLDESRSGG